MKIARPLLITLLPGLVVVAGCQSHGPMSAEEHAQRTAEAEYDTVVFTDYDLNREFSEHLMGPDKTIRITAEKHGLRRTDTGTSEVWAVLRNHTDHNYTLEARTQFFADGGMPVDADPVWKRISVPANARATYKEKSVSTNDLQYRVEVRQAQ